MPPCPDLAFWASFLPNDDVRLARMKFIINHTIGILPTALAHPERVQDLGERGEIKRRTNTRRFSADELL